MATEAPEPRRIDPDPVLKSQHLNLLLTEASDRLADARSINNMLVAESAKKDEIIASLEQQVSDRDAEIMALREQIVTTD